MPGIGPKRKKQIQSAFPSLKKMRAATFADFEQYLPEKTAALLYTRLHEHDEQADEGIDAVQELDETVSAELPAETEQTDHPDAEAGKGETV